VELDRVIESDQQTMIRNSGYNGSSMIEMYDQDLRL
jgi:hypothetical protein